MATVKVTSKFQILDLIDQFVDGTTASALGETIVNSAKELIASGQSPVDGYGRFEGYSASYQAEIKGNQKARVKAAVAKAVAKVSKSSKAKKKIVGNKARAKAKDLEQKYGKKVRPINLFLTGEMLDGYDYRIQGDVIEVGMVSGSQDRKDIASYHNDGTSKMPQRKIVPGPGESFTITIMRAIADVYGSRLADLIRQSGKNS